MYLHFDVFDFFPNLIFSNGSNAHEPKILAVTSCTRTSLPQDFHSAVAGALSEAEYAERLYQAMASEAADDLAASEQRAAKRALRKAELKVRPSGLELLSCRYAGNRLSKGIYRVNRDIACWLLAD